MYPHPNPIGLGSFLPQARALFARMSSPPGYRRKILINRAIADLIRAGVWSKLDALWVFAAADSQAALLNWLSSSYGAANVGGMTFTADRGFTGDGVGAYIDTNYAPSGGPLYLQNSHAFGRWMRTASGSAADMGAYNGGGSYGVIRSNASGPTVTTVDGPNTVTDTAASITGTVAVSRSGSGAYSVYRNGISIATPSTTSQAPATSEITIGAENNTGTPTNFSTSQFGAGFAGGALTATEQLALHNALQAYMTGVGA